MEIKKAVLSSFLFFFIALFISSGFVCSLDAGGYNDNSSDPTLSIGTKLTNIMSNLGSLLKGSPASTAPSEPAPNEGQIPESAVKAALNSYNTKWNNIEYNDPTDDPDLEFTQWVDSNKAAFTEEQYSTMETGWGQRQGSTVKSMLKGNLKTAKADGILGGLFKGEGSSASDSGVDVQNTWDFGKFIFSGKAFYGALLGIFIWLAGLILSFIPSLKNKSMIKQMSGTKFLNIVILTEVFWLAFALNLSLGPISVRLIAILLATWWAVVTIWNFFREKDLSLNSPLLIVPITFYISTTNVSGFWNPGLALLQTLIIVGTNFFSVILDKFFEGVKNKFNSRNEQAEGDADDAIAGLEILDSTGKAYKSYRGRKKYN